MSNFPAYPSGHATFGAAAFHITRIFYGKDLDDKDDDELFPGFFVSDEFNGGNRDNDGTVRPRHTRFFRDGLWQMIIENALSRIFLGVHWIFDAFNFTGGLNGPLNPSLDNERIGGVGLGLRIARDIYTHGNNGDGPQMTPANADPPIITPPANSPMPARPAQPAEVGGCIGPAVDPLQAQSAKDKPSKKVAAKGAAAAEAAAQEQEPWPSGVSEQDENPPAVQSAWPSGISEK